MNISDIVFPNYLTGIKDDSGDWFKGGYTYQAREGDTGGWTARWIINDIKHFSGADLTGEYVEISHFVSDPLVVWEFPNGYKIKVIFETIKRPEYITVLATVNLYDDTDTAVGNIPNVYTAYSTYNFTLYGDTTVLPSVAGNDSVVMDVVLNTVYYPDAYPPSGTPCRGVVLAMIVGNISAGFIIHPGTCEGWSTQLGYGHAMTLGSFLDLDGFTSYLHEHGKPFEGDLFTDEPIPDDPAGSDDTSEPGGGGGNYDDTSDPIDFPALPQGGALESGSIIAHRVVKQTLEAIFSKLWTKSIFDLDAMWQKSIENPMDAIVSLHALPCSPQVVADPNNIYIGNLDMEVTSPKLTSQYIEVDCGTVTLQEFWGSALDYSPYTRVEIYLPFIGVQTLRTEDVMKTAVHVKYHVDALTGDCIAFIKCGLSVLYTFNGNCKMNIPLSARSTDFLQKVAAAAGLAIGAVGVSVGGGAALAGATKAAQIDAAQKTATAADIQSNSMAVSSAANIASTKINTSRSGDISGGLSLMASFVPYFIIHRPVQSLAKDFNKFKGYTSNITKRLGDLTGFTEVEHINLQGIPNATAAEMAEIKTALRNGVIF